MFDKNFEIEYINKKISKCEKCSLHLSRNTTVPGEGNINSPIVFVGEGPGADEDATGHPFVGKAGQFLEKMLVNWSKLKKSDVYITNIVKCRPPKNRVPTTEEIKLCTPFLESQLIILKPKIIVALGSTSLKYFGINKKITAARGHFFDWKGNIKIFATFHPSYLIRNQSMEKNSPTWYASFDMKAIGWMYKAFNSGKTADEIVKVINERMKASGGV
ncbi:DNA polymerase [Tepiditoga spiralis]|uniref:Type-4 uracil-DNA glycosylase n=1 Tax=Tepiditoga spiralis TaxID=2108365 RepID=A0A7G1GAC9_9BACT|nr:uracil-DNA glycosylase [Tepiditoga spiralis]BBE31102.1 DNA polymerase [Tepiditoga spiralis]